jgi:hypothetical protein
MTKTIRVKMPLVFLAVWSLLDRLLLPSGRWELRRGTRSPLRDATRGCDECGAA